VQLGYIAQGLLLVVSGVYYDVSVLPGWMQALARISRRPTRSGVAQDDHRRAGVSSLGRHLAPM